VRFARVDADERRSRSGPRAASPRLVFCALTLIWLTGYAIVVAKVGDVLRRPRVRRVLDGLTGAVLLGLGVRVATEHR
jgi:threonine/homoserine/homoserine lactone efflux protein